MRTIKTLRWFGQNDPISLNDILQTGATGVVTALHHIPNGEIWTTDEILKRKHKIESQGLTWEVVESLPVHENIKKNIKSEKLIANYKQSIINLSRCGLKTICYNFMPVLDWARTSLDHKLENGAETMYFDKALFAAFDIFILNRPHAKSDYSRQEIKDAKSSFSKLSTDQKNKLGYNIIVKTQSFIDGAIKDGEENYLKIFNKLLEEYQDINKEKLRQNFAYFLSEVIPIAESSNINLAIHPDDPPFNLLGLPRIFSTEGDFDWLRKINPSLHNGVTFCSGSLGARRDNNLISIFKKNADRVHFIHLRNTQMLNNGDFYETNHLSHSTIILMKVIIEELKLRKENGRSDYNIPLRPDHGHKILDDFKRDSNPGYPLIGRLKGLAELTGLELGLSHKMYN